VHFGHSIRFTQQALHIVDRRSGFHLRPIEDIRRRQPNPEEISERFDFCTFDRDAQASGFTIEIIAIARRQRKHQELSAIDARTNPMGLAWDGQGLRGLTRADGDFVTGG
jgi:hypothetical protein